MQYVLANLHWFLLLIGALVFFHELGHFAVAKACNIRVLRFSLGFGPRLFNVRFGETEYSLSLFPLGGYVKMYGEGPNSEIEEAEKNRAFAYKPLWQRTAVVLAGPVANFILAIVVYTCMFTGPHVFGDTKLGVVTMNGPAWLAGLRPGDKIIAVNHEPVDRWEQLRDAISDRPNQTLDLTYERGGQKTDVRVHVGARLQPNAFAQSEEHGQVGVSLVYLKPILSVVDTLSPAALAGLKSGDSIESVNRVPVAAWHEVRERLGALPADLEVQLGVVRDGQHLQIGLHPIRTFPQGLAEDRFSSADVQGGYTGLVNQDVVVKKIESNTPAQRIGLQAGDRLLSLAITTPDGNTTRREVGVWEVDLANFGLDARSELTLSYQRGRQVLQHGLHLQAKTEQDMMNNPQTSYVFGASNDAAALSDYTYERGVGVFEAMYEATLQVGEDMSLVAMGVGKMLQGALPVSSMGGPMMLFVIAEHSAKQGSRQFLRTLSVISINLGMLNLLPIPLLDGGHLLFFAIEAIMRRPPSLRVREYANMVGMAFVLMLMLLVFKNDFTRFLF